MEELRDVGHHRLFIWPSCADEVLDVQELLGRRAGRQRSLEDGVALHEKCLREWRDALLRYGMRVSCSQRRSTGPSTARRSRLSLVGGGG